MAVGLRAIISGALVVQVPSVRRHRRVGSPLTTRPARVSARHRDPASARLPRNSKNVQQLHGQISTVMAFSVDMSAGVLAAFEW